MAISTRSAAKKLGITVSAVANLVKKGVLKDISGKSGRHFFKFSAQDVNDFARSYKKQIHHEHYLNGSMKHVTVTLPETVTEWDKLNKASREDSPVGRIQSIIQRLDKLDGRMDDLFDKMDALMEMWK